MSGIQPFQQHTALSALCILIALCWKFSGFQCTFFCIICQNRFIIFVQQLPARGIRLHTFDRTIRGQIFHHGNDGAGGLLPPGGIQHIPLGAHAHQQQHGGRTQHNGGRGNAHDQLNEGEAFIILEVSHAAPPIS